MLKKDLLAGSAGGPFVGVYHYRVTPVYWETLVSHSEVRNYGFTNEEGNHGAAELLNTQGESANLSSFQYYENKITSFLFYFTDKIAVSGIIEIDGVKRDFERSTMFFPTANEDGTLEPPHDIIRPACTSGKPFELKFYIHQFDARG